MEVEFHAFEAEGVRKQVLGIESANGLRSFKLLDLNNTWWEISNVSQAHYDDIFARGDYAH